MANTIVGSVARLWTFPVKSMRGGRIEQGEFTDLRVLRGTASRS